MQQLKCQIRLAFVLTRTLFIDVQRVFFYGVLQLLQYFFLILPFLATNTPPKSFFASFCFLFYDYTRRGKVLLRPAMYQEILPTVPN